MIVLLEIVGKNVLSLQSVSREEELMTELRTFGWDVSALSETWCEKKLERWITEDAHLFVVLAARRLTMALPY